MMTDMMTEYAKGASQQNQVPIEEQPYTRDWYRKRFNEQEHRIGTLSTELVDYMQQVRMLRKQVSDLSLHLEAARVSIGELIDRVAATDKLSNKIDEVSKRVDKASEVVTGLRRDLKQPA